ncbi:MAG TPA: polymer-forming cytoskeletal protein [Candidatus Saccharimonadales bacterium]|nr:polymer-forming cytoskeletal protein [Candidatus Saccharimonadales bacterium]
MKKGSWLALSLVGAFLLLIFVGARAQAWTEFKSGNSANVPSGQTVDSSLWAGAKTIDIAGTVNGDVFCGAQTLNISGTVKGDVICGAQTINISGTIEGDVRLGAQTVNLDGTVNGNATIGAQTITTDSRSKISGDASLGGGDLHLNGTIGRDLAMSVANATLSGSVTRDIKGQAGHITLNNTAKVGGGIEYTSKNQISIAEGADVGGKVTQKLPENGQKAWVTLGWFGNGLALILALLLLLTAFVLTVIFPRLVHTVSGQAIRRPWWVLLTGFLASIFVPIIVVLLMITVIGIPLGILLLLSWILVAITSGWFTAYYVGRMVWHSQRNPLAIIVVGGVILLVLYLIPYIGFFMMLVSFWIGSGMVLLELKDRYHKPHYNLN